MGELIDEDTRTKGVVKKEVDLNGLLKEICVYPPFIIGEYPGMWGFNKDEIPVTTRDINHKIKEFPLLFLEKLIRVNFPFQLLRRMLMMRFFGRKN